MARRAPRREVTLARPRMSVLEVLRRVRMRLLDIQVWDVAGTMTFYTLLSVFPAAIAMVSLVSLMGIQQQTVDTLGDLVHEIFPSVDPEPYERVILSMARTGGGLTAFLLGTIGALISASNGVAAFHRALHRVYDTREGRPFLWFRTIVFGETLVIVSMVVFATLVVTIGGEWSQRLGAYAGIPSGAFAAWNLVKWPVLLVLLILGVSLAYYLFPNVKLPRYRPMTLGSVLSVLVLFGSALVVGRLASLATRFSEVITALNGLVAILLLLWLANIVIVAGAALDAEFLRARQLALGLAAWDRIVLEPHASHSLEYLQTTAEDYEELAREVVEAVRTGEPLRRPRSVWVVDASSPLAVNPSARYSRAIRAAARPDPAPEEDS
ncbi:YihY/virulence factor BrkB family protein [Brachybacterium huguangmaarense]|uniref:YihY/virulence factor BrkB family protein n=1 Tax=Brachybacterium huguangmaarense TaxID=1652028 RepID=A0ABY6G4L4_9MICO|nr:YihY/virulence factor BrkB family protein [Brachybacterium huguangmaarense]UYG18155.1 YihY/virulence factor BrkB family protein [Brachybacterium huguangmaarense]